MSEPLRVIARNVRDAPAGSRALLVATGALVVCYAIALAALGTVPHADDTGQQVVDWFREHGTTVRWSVWATTVAAPVSAVLFVLLRRLLPAPHRDVFLVGAILWIAATMAETWFAAGLALHADRLEPATARTVLDVAIFFGPVLTGATVTTMAPVTVLALRGQAGLPRWLGALGAVAIVEQAIETVTIFGSSGFIEPGGAMNMQLGGALVAIWLVAFGVWGGLRGRPAASP